LWSNHQSLIQKLQMSYLQAIHMLSRLTPEESFSIDGAASMLFLSLSNRNKLGCFKINCHSKQTMETAGLRKSRRDVTA